MLDYRRKLGSVVIVLGVFGSTIFSASCYYVCEYLDQRLKRMPVLCTLCFEVDADPYDTVGEAYESWTKLSEMERKPYIEIEEEKKENRKGMNESITWKGVFYVIHKRYIVAENIGLFVF